MSKIKDNAVIDCPFTFWTDNDTEATMLVSTPCSIRSLLGGTEGSILDAYGGEYRFDNYDVRLYKNRGVDNGVTIAYGKNLTDIEQEENVSNVYTGVHPFYYTEQDGLHELPEKVVNAEGKFNFRNISPLDLTYEFDEWPGEDALRNEAIAYMKRNDVGAPKVSIDISFLQLSQSKEYETLEVLERVQLCDIVTVHFRKLGIDAKAKCVSYKYNVLTNTYEEITLGEARSNLAASLSDQNQSYKEDLSNTKSSLTIAIDQATKEITGGLGGYVVIRSSTGEKKPDEILIMDTDDITTAQQVWRWNKGGLGYSKTGYAGPYGTAITQSGQIVADYITTGTLDASIITVTNLNASNITTGTITSKDGSTYINLDTGSAKFTGTVNATDGYFSGTVYASKLSGQIVGTQIANETITGGNIANSTIGGGKIGSSTITGGNIGGNTVTRGNLQEKYATSAQYNTLSADVANLKQITTGAARATWINTVALAVSNTFYLGGYSGTWGGFVDGNGNTRYALMRGSYDGA